MPNGYHPSSRQELTLTVTQARLIIDQIDDERLDDFTTVIDNAQGDAKTTGAAQQILLTIEKD